MAFLVCLSSNVCVIACLLDRGVSDRVRTTTSNMLQSQHIIRKHISAAEVSTFVSHLAVGDRFVLIFMEPSSSHPQQLHMWHGIVVPTPDERWKRRAIRCAQFQECGHRILFALPPDPKDVTIVDIFLDAASLARHALGSPSFSTTSFTHGPENSTTDFATPFVRLREADRCPAPSTPNDGPESGGMTHQNSATGLTSAYSTDMVQALQRRLYPHRRIIVWVCLPEIKCDDLVDNLEAEIIKFSSPTVAQQFIREHIGSMLALVTSSLKNEFELEGIGGPDLCNEVRSLRKTAALPVGAQQGERCWPLTIIVTKTLAMSDCIESCDIFVHALKSTDTICLTEISRRLAPPSIVCVNVDISTATRDFIEKELSFSIHQFDTTYRAYQFVLACPWNVAAIITEQCQHLQREGHLTGVELGHRIKHLNLSRFQNPKLVLVGRADEDASTFDLVVGNDTPKDQLETQLKSMLADLSKKHQRARVPGAVVFGRGAHTSLSPTYPSPFTVTIDGEEMTFPNVEQFFQASKHYGNAALFASIRDAPSIHTALQLAWQSRIDPQEWNALRDDAMFYGLSKKFSLPEFARRLLLTGDKDIVHATLYSEDNYWGDGADGGTHRGRNRMGEMLMSIRSMLQSTSGGALSSSLRDNATELSSVAIAAAASCAADRLTMNCPLQKLRHRPRSASRGHRANGANVFEINKNEILGKGAYGRVYKARDLFTNQIVAAKVATVAQADEALRKEFQLLSTVDDNNVVKVYHAELPDSGTATIFMEYMSGGSLEAQAQSFRLYEMAIRGIVQQILEGLDALHRRYGIVHCDLKPGNVLMSGQDVKISDFGASAFVSTSSAPMVAHVAIPPATPSLRHNGSGQTQEVVHPSPQTGNRSFTDRPATPVAQNPLRGAPGTPEYMSLTRMESSEASFADDVWAVGCIVVRLALGGPFQPWWQPGDIVTKLQPLMICYRMQQQPCHPYIPDDLSPHARSFILKCFTFNPLDRPTAQQLLTDPWFSCGSAGMESLDDYRAAKAATFPDGLFEATGDRTTIMRVTVMDLTGSDGASRGGDDTDALCRV
jgi:ribA/ribD-fused uncharacterized protein